MSSISNAPNNKPPVNCTTDWDDSCLWQSPGTYILWTIAVFSITLLIYCLFAGRPLPARIRNLLHRLPPSSPSDRQPGSTFTRDPPRSSRQDGGRTGSGPSGTGENNEGPHTTNEHATPSSPDRESGVELQPYNAVNNPPCNKADRESADGEGVRAPSPVSIREGDVVQPH